jgi:hypothetical protein
VKYRIAGVFAQAGVKGRNDRFWALSDLCNVNIAPMIRATHQGDWNAKKGGRMLDYMKAKGDGRQ